MTIQCKRFDELTTRELYELLRARSQIFVAEQKCPYQDIDGKDYESLHLFFEENGKVTAYLRAYRKAEDTVQIGRVLTVTHGEGTGRKLLEEGLIRIRQLMKPRRICIEAQRYATGFYEKAGFRICSEEFSEDGIPHVRMILELATEDGRE